MRSVRGGVRIETHHLFVGQGMPVNLLRISDGRMVCIVESAASSQSRGKTMRKNIPAQHPIFPASDLTTAALKALGRPTAGPALVTESGSGAHSLAWAAKGCAPGPACGVVGREAQPGRHRGRAGRWHWQRVGLESPRVKGKASHAHFVNSPPTVTALGTNCVVCQI